MRLFLRARAVINFLMEAASTLEITNGEQRALRKFPTSWNLSLLKRCFAPSKKAKAKFCEHFQTGWDHSIPLYVLPEHAEDNASKTSFTLYSNSRNILWYSVRGV